MKKMIIVMIIILCIVNSILFSSCSLKDHFKVVESAMSNQSEIVTDNELYNIYRKLINVIEDNNKDDFMKLFSNKAKNSVNEKYDSIERLFKLFSDNITVCAEDDESAPIETGKIDDGKLTKIFSAAYPTKCNNEKYLLFLSYCKECPNTDYIGLNIIGIMKEDDENALMYIDDEDPAGIYFYI